MASAMVSLTCTASSLGLCTRAASKPPSCRALGLPQLGAVRAIRLQTAPFARGLRRRSEFCVRVGGVLVCPNPASSSTVRVAASNSVVNGGAAIVAAAVSRAMVAAALISEAVMRAARALAQTLTATPLPNPHSSAEKELVTALKGRLVLAAGPLFFAAIRQPGSVSTPLTVVASGMAKWLELYSGVLMVRVLLSWFPNIPWERQPLQAVRDMCDPYLNLFRNIIPPLFNALDLSPMLAFMVLGVLTSILNTTVHG